VSSVVPPTWIRPEIPGLIDACKRLILKHF
jgi:hypothetical protein